jgi:hypothetical protein
MNKPSVSLSELQQQAVDKAALVEVETSELETINGGSSIDGYPECGTKPPGLVPPVRPHLVAS